MKIVYDAFANKSVFFRKLYAKSGDEKLPYKSLLRWWKIE